MIRKKEILEPVRLINIHFLLDVIVQEPVIYIHLEEFEI